MRKFTHTPLLSLTRDISGPPLGFLMQRVVIMHLDKPILVLNVVLYLNADQSRSEAERDANGNTALELLILFQEGQNLI